METPMTTDEAVSTSAAINLGALAETREPVVASEASARGSWQFDWPRLALLAWMLGVIAVGAMGFGDMSIDNLITMQIHRIDEAFIKDLQSLGFNNLPFNKLVSMRIHRVDGAFVKEMEEAGYSRIPADKLVSMRIHRVDGKFVKEMKEAGYNNLSVDDLINLRIHGVDAGEIKKMKGIRD